MVLGIGKSRYKLLDDAVILSRHTVSFSIPLLQLVLFNLTSHRDDDPLENHITTLVHYLEHHEEILHSHSDGTIRYIDPKYLVAQCLRKMYQRIPSQGSIVYLKNILAGELRELVFNMPKNPTGSKRNSQGLAAVLVEMVKDGSMDLLIRGYLESEWDLTHLKDPFIRTVGLSDRTTTTCATCITEPPASSFTVCRYPLRIYEGTQ